MGYLASNLILKMNKGDFLRGKKATKARTYWNSNFISLFVLFEGMC
jgi:hypothetical protein